MKTRLFYAQNSQAIVKAKLIIGSMEEYYDWFTKKLILANTKNRHRKLFFKDEKDFHDYVKDEATLKIKTNKSLFNTETGMYKTDVYYQVIEPAELVDKEPVIASYDLFEIEAKDGEARMLTAKENELLFQKYAKFPCDQLSEKRRYSYLNQFRNKDESSWTNALSRDIFMSYTLFSLSLLLNDLMCELSIEANEPVIVNLNKVIIFINEYIKQKTVVSLTDKCLRVIRENPGFMFGRSDSRYNLSRLSTDDIQAKTIREIDANHGSFFSDGHSHLPIVLRNNKTYSDGSSLLPLLPIISS